MSPVIDAINAAPARQMCPDFDPWRFPITDLKIYAVLILALAIGGCVWQPPEPAGKFFTDPHELALAEALQWSDWAGAERAMHAGANVNAIGNEGMYPLAWTMYHKNKAAFEWLLDHGADPNIKSRNSYHNEDLSVLFFAVEAEDPEWLRMLLAHRANPNLTRKSIIGTTQTPLSDAMDPPRLTQLQMLIAAGADINYHQPAEDGGGTPAIDAAESGFFEGVYVLIEAGADIRPRTSGGWDLTYEVARHSFGLSDAAASWRDKVLQQLRRRGADVDGAFREVQAAEDKYRRDNPWRYQQ